MRVLLRCVALRLQARLAYRGDLLATVGVALLTSAVGPLFLLALFRHIPTLAGWTGPELLFCWGFADAVSGLFYVLFGGLYVLNQRYILGGELDRLLLRPLDPYVQLLVDHLSLEDLPTVGMGALIMGAALAWGLPPLGVGLWLWLPLSVGMGTCVLGGVLTAVASLGFHLQHRGTAIGLTLQLSTFARYPLDLFASPLRAVLTWVLPFGFAGFYGAVGFLHHPDYATFAGFQPLVAGLSLGLGYGAWRVGLRRYSSRGG